MPEQHLWIVGDRQAGRSRGWEQLALPPLLLPPVSANRRLRGAYTAAGSILRAVVPEAQHSSPELVAQHAVELLTACPELRDQLRVSRQTLTSLAVPEERTRYYSALRTLRIAHGIAEFLQDYLRTTGSGRRSVVIDDLHHADYTDQELVGVLLRRLDPQQVQLVLGSRKVFAARPTDSTDPTHPPAADLPAKLAQHCRQLIAPAHPEADSAADPQHYVNSDCTDDTDQARAGYLALPVELRQQLHDRRAAELRSAGEASLRCGAIPFHLMRGTDPTRRGLAAVDAAMDEAMRLGFYDLALEFCEIGAAAVAGSDRPELWWRFTAKLPTMLSAIGRAEDAEQACVQARSHTTNPEYHHQLAYATAMLYTRHLDPLRQDQLMAAGWANLAIAIASTIPDAKRRSLYTVFYRNGLALVEAHQGHPERALQLVSNGLAELDAVLDASDHLLHRSVLRHNRGQVLAALKRPEEALDDFRAVIAADPNYPEYHFDAANLLRKLGRADEALAEYQTAAQLGPPFPELFYNRADLLAELGRLDEALAAYDYVLELDPDHVDALVNRAGLLADLDEPDRADVDVRHGLRLAPTNQHLLALRGRLDLDAGRYDLARTALDAALEIDPTLAGGWALRGSLNFTVGAFDAALADFDQAAELEPDAAVLFNRATVAQALGRWSQAEHDFAAVIELAPDEPDSWLGRSACRRALGDREGAAADAGRFRVLAPERAEELDAVAASPAFVGLDGPAAG